MKRMVTLFTGLLLLSACISINIGQNPASKDVKDTPVPPPAPTVSPASAQQHDGTNFIDPTDGNTYRWVKVRVYYPIPSPTAVYPNTYTPSPVPVYTPSTQPVTMRWTPAPGTFTDERDGHLYKTVTIGHQMWMAENLAYKTPGGYKYYNDDPKNAGEYGLLYNIEALAQAAPKGWHIPTNAEWQQLEYSTGMSAQDTSKLMNRGTTAFNFFVGGASGMNVKFSGCYAKNIYAGIGQTALFFTATPYDKVNRVARAFGNGSGIIGNDRFGEGWWLSVRCVKD